MFRAKMTGLLISVFAITYFSAEAQEGDAFKWSVQYLVDSSQQVFGRPQSVYPRRNRGLGLSPDGRYLYAGYHQSFSNSGEVRKIDVTGEDFTSATRAVLSGVMGKSIAVDDEGRVYLAENSAIKIYDAGLKRLQLDIETEDCEGVAVTREEGALVVYATERKEQVLKRWVLQTRDDQVSGAVPEGLSMNGLLHIPEASSLRGVAVDGQGRIWMADVAANKVFRVDRDGTNLVSTQINSPIGVGIDGDRCYITRYQDRVITIVDSEMNLVGNLEIPWKQLELSPTGNKRTGALTGIVVMPGRGFYVANEGGQTADEKSTYGRADDHTDFFGGKLYKDSFVDDNDPILRALRVAAE